MKTFRIVLLVVVCAVTFGVSLAVTVYVTDEMTNPTVSR
jgi:hypothetical protein